MLHIILMFSSLFTALILDNLATDQVLLRRQRVFCCSPNQILDFVGHRKIPNGLPWWFYTWKIRLSRLCILKLLLQKLIPGFDSVFPFRIIGPCEHIWLICATRVLFLWFLLQSWAACSPSLRISIASAPGLSVNLLWLLSMLQAGGIIPLESVF